MIYLQASPEVLKKRLRKKNVAGETQVTDDYIEEVKAYEHFSKASTDITHSYH